MLTIDSDLNLYTPQNIHADAGSVGMLFRAFVRPARPVTYTFDLKIKGSELIALHRRLGFEEVQRDFTFPGASFARGGVGILYRLGQPPNGLSGAEVS